MSKDAPVSGSKLYTVPRLAQRLRGGRDWIRRGHVEPPPELPATGEKGYDTKQVERIELWYMRRAAAGGTRGPEQREEQ